MGVLFVFSFFPTIYYLVASLYRLFNYFKENHEIKILDFIKETKEVQIFLVCATICIFSGTLTKIEMNKNELERRNKEIQRADIARRNYEASLQKPAEQPKLPIEKESVEQSIPPTPAIPKQAANIDRTGSYGQSAKSANSSGLSFSVKNMEQLNSKDDNHVLGIIIQFTISNATNSKIVLRNDDFVALKSGHNSVKSYSAKFFLKTTPVTYKYNSIEIFPGDIIEKAQFFFPIEEKGQRLSGWKICYVKSSNDFIPIANID